MLSVSEGKDSPSFDPRQRILAALCFTFRDNETLKNPNVQFT
jgi:hypothetical protein